MEFLLLKFVHGPHVRFGHWSAVKPLYYKLLEQSKIALGAEPPETGCSQNDTLMFHRRRAKEWDKLKKVECKNADKKRFKEVFSFTDGRKKTRATKDHLKELGELAAGLTEHQFVEFGGGAGATSWKNDRD